MKKRPYLARITPLFWLMPVLLLCVLPEATVGQEVIGLRDYEALAGEQVGTVTDSGKVSASLRAVLAKMAARGIARRDARELGAAALSNALVRVNEGGSIHTYIQVHTFEDAEKTLLEMHEVIIEISNAELGIIQAWVPFDRIDEVAQLPFVKRITPPRYGTPQVGSVTTEGDAILRANALRARGFDGSGVKVGVISDGANNRADAAATGDLPSSLTVFGTCDPAVTDSTCNEGTAMLEIVHDLAPGAELGFGAVLTTLEFIQRVDELTNTFGADVIVDDVSFFGEPYFEDGPVARAVARAVASGVVYVPAAGNAAETHYQARYVDSGDGFSSHDFGGGDTTLPIAGPFGEVVVFLQWSNAFGMAGDNYDLCLIDAAGTTTITCSLDPQDGNDDPIEILVLNCSNPDGCTGNIQIRRFSGNAQELEMFFSNTRPTQFNVSADSIFGHRAVPGVLATAAIDASDPGHNDIETFSSRGPATIFFPAPETRQKPDVAAVNGVAVTGVGGFESPFFGTSAAAPHAAGVAALLKSALPTATATEIVAVLQNSAVDLGAPGPDNTFGAGRIDALAAALQLDQPPDGVIDTPTGDVTINQGDAVTFTGTGTDPDGHLPLTFVWDFGGGAPNSTQEDPGAVPFNTPGTFTVTFTVTDSLGLADPTPDTRTVTVTALRRGGGGGGCTVSPGASFDPILVGIMGLMLAYLGWQRPRRRPAG